MVGHLAEVPQAAWSPDERFVGSASYDGTARIWDAATGDLVAILDHQGNWVMTLAFSPDGARVLTAQGDGQAMIWDLPRYTGSAAELGLLVRCRVPYQVVKERLVPRAREVTACASLNRMH